MTFTWLSNTPKSHSCLAISVCARSFLLRLTTESVAEASISGQFGYLIYYLVVSAPLTLLQSRIYLQLTSNDCVGYPRRIRCNLSLNQIAYPWNNCAHIPWWGWQLKLNLASHTELLKVLVWSRTPTNSKSNSRKDLTYYFSIWNLLLPINWFVIKVERSKQNTRRYCRCIYPSITHWFSVLRVK